MSKFTYTKLKGLEDLGDPKYSMQNLGRSEGGKNNGHENLDHSTNGRKGGKNAYTSNKKSGVFDEFRNKGTNAAAKLNTENRKKLQQAIVDLLPNTQFGSKEVKEACAIFNMSKGYYKTILKSDLIITIQVGKSKQTPGIYKKKGDQ